MVKEECILIVEEVYNFTGSPQKLPKEFISYTFLQSVTNVDVDVENEFLWTEFDLIEELFEGLFITILE